ncbi:PTS transporter subunit EIIC [Clostridium sp. MSJ-4]|uniref:Permease IIC component n=1 Tax=Clostridium simiarum TaxID=2841506 RepID=A0ABS6F3I3_9CLOT|nr:PTS transporter subunit EIIC [Clostridium simiarum]MBU5592960.1 PTS transporter subunit EIIC [Clostridium simiarum]
MSQKSTIMSKFTKYLEEKLVPIGEKISSQRHLRAIRDGMVAATPLTLLGGAILIISSPPVNLEVIKPTNFFYKFLITWKKFAMENGMNLELPFRMSMGIMALFIAIAISYSLAKSYNIDPLGSLIVSAVTFLVVAAPSNLGVMSKTIGKDMVGAKILENQSILIPSHFLGAEGIFTAIIIAIITTEITRILKQKGFVIKMPDSVPPAIMASFESIIPLAVSVILFFLVSLGIESISGMLIPELIMKAIHPLVGAVDSPGGIIVISILTQLLWVVGLHGSSIVTGAVGVFELGNLANNANLVSLGKEAAFIYTEPFRAFFMIIGGAGATMGLVILLLRSKSAQLKNLGKLAIIPSIFNINEPIIFGVPLVLNPILAIPFVIVQIVNGLIAYGVMKMGILGKTYLAVPWTTPSPIGGFLATMDYKAPIIIILLIVLDIIIWYPFFKAYEKQLLEVESK